MDFIIIFLLVYIAIIETFDFFDIHLPTIRIEWKKPEPMMRKVIAPQVIEEKETEHRAAIIERPNAKKLRILNDPKRKDGHDAFMGVLDSDPVLRASREATDPSKKGYVA